MLLCRLAVISIVLFVATAAAGPLRVVSMNASNAGSASAGPRGGMEAILTAIGQTVGDDPLLPGDSGIARPVDILCLQEARSSIETAAPYAALLNQIYNTTRYAAGTLNGASTGSGTQAVVYNTETVQLLGMAAVGTTSTAGLPRQVMRYRFRPTGLISAEADVFVYNLHAKAGNTSTDRSRRLVEAQVIRSDADALGPGRNVIYLGDLNVYRASEPMYEHLRSPGNAAAFDPINAPGDWSNNAAFKSIHTQSPWDSNLAADTGFNGTSGGVDDRFDQQLISSAVVGGTSGLQYAINSYHAFGNDGTHVFDQPINTGIATSAPVLDALAGILDHLPVVADYHLRPRLGLAHPGDADLDLHTDIDDFGILATNFNAAGTDWFTGDFSGDGTTDIDDFSFIAAHFNTAAAATAARPAAVPEPSFGALAACGFGILVRRARRHPVA